MTATAFVKRPGIGGKLLLWFLAVSLLPLLVAGYSGVRRSSSTLREEVTESLTAVADTKVREIGTYVRERRRNVTTLARNPIIVAAMSEFTHAYKTGGAESPEYVAADVEHRSFLTSYQEENGYYDLFLISPTGNVVFSVRKGDDSATDLDSEPYRDSELAKSFENAATFHIAEMSDFRYYAPSDKPAAFIAAPVFESDRLIGVVALQTDMHEIYTLAGDYTGLGDTGETMIASKEDDELVIVAPLRHDRKAAFQRRLQLGSQQASPVQKAVQGERGSGISVDYRDKEVLAVWRYISDVRWGVVAKIDTSEAFEAADRLQAGFMVIGVITMFGVVVAAALISRSISKPIHALHKGTEIIGSGNLEHRVGTDRNDEIGQLSRAFDQMAVDLGRVTASRDELEHEISERERAEAELKATASELERHNKLMSGREGAVLELKGAINDLLGELGRSPTFKTTVRADGAIPAVAKTGDGVPATPSEPRPSPEPPTRVEVNSEAAERTGLEKTNLDIAFIPIICSAPLIYAHSHGFFAQNGLDVNLKPAPGWSGVKNLMAYGKVDAAHMLAPMPLACNLGINARKADIRLATIQNVNGQALTLARKHLGIKDVRDMKGFTFGVPYRFSMHYYLLCHLLAAGGVDPLTDVTIREVAPPRMPYYLAKGWVDGVFAPEPFNQIPVHRGIGFIYVLSKDIWAGHPCCCFATSQDFIDRHPNTYRVMLDCVLQAELALHRANPNERKAIAREICDPGHLNQRDPAPVEQALSGEFPDGKGGQHVVPDRIDFIPYPWPEYGEWILSQMQRWAQLPGSVDYREVVESVFQDGTRELAEALGFEKQGKPALEAIHPFASQDPFTYMREQPFCAFQEQPKPVKAYDVSEPVRARLAEVCSHLGDIAGGKTDAPLEITSDGEIGQLEQIVNETLLNLRFAQEAVLEQMDLLETRAEELDKSRKVLLGLTEDAEQARKEAEKEIAERQRAEAAVETARLDLEQTVAASSPLCVIALDCSILRANQPLSDLLQMPREQIEGRPCTDILGGPHCDKSLCPLERFSSKEESEPIEITLKRSDNVEVTCLRMVQPFRDISGQVVGVVESFTDITERKAAQRELALRSVIAEICLYVPDDEMYGDVLRIVLRAMDSKYGVFGYIDEDGALVVPTMTRDIWDQCQVADKDLVFPRETWGDSTWPVAIREKRTICQNGLSVKTPPGHIPMDRHISLPVIHQEEVIGLFQVANKETDYDEADVKLLEMIGGVIAPVLNARLQRDRQERARQRAEQELVGKAEELARSNAELADFAYVASHDLQEPLRMVGSYLRLLERRYEDKLDGDAREFIEFAVDGAKRMQTLIEDLLAYSRVTTRGTAFEPVDSNEVVDEVIQNLQVTIEETDATVTRDDLPTVAADRTQLVQLVQNLVGNAIKFHGQEPPQVQVSAQKPDEVWVFSVRDNGIGIDPKYADRIFKIFQRLHTREEYSGTGIGLAVCRRIVDRHEGRIWFESQPGKGTTFFFTLSKKGGSA